jgi:hypothetical protein
MNPFFAESPTAPLLFNWDSLRGQKVAITVFLALSVVAHALCFYIFQIVYPPTVALLPPPARLMLITPASDEGRALLHWIDAEDPALVFTTLRPRETKLRALPKAEHVPFYSAVQPSLKEIPPLERGLSIPSSEPPGAVRLARRKKTAAVTSITNTAVSFSSEFDTFGAPILPQFNFASSNEEAPQTLRFRVAVNALGEIQYCFQINSSGDPALDQQARSYLERCRFPRRGGNAGKTGWPLTWGTATIQWGNDVAASQPAKSASILP